MRSLNNNIVLKDKLIKQHRKSLVKKTKLSGPKRTQYTCISDLFRNPKKRKTSRSNFLDFIHDLKNLEFQKMKYLIKEYIIKEDLGKGSNSIVKVISKIDSDERKVAKIINLKQVNNSKDFQGLKVVFNILKF